MDPLAHTLFGAALADAGLKRASRYATAALLIGANLPDVDVVAQFWGADTALYLRRGWTHGVLAMAALPLLLTGAILLWHRWRGGKRSADMALHAGPLLAVGCVAVWSHPLLDWLNTYGVRLLMPFDRRWFYGDTLFIVDPWVWLMLAAGVVMARSATRRAKLGWLLLGAGTTYLVLTRDLPAGVGLAWCVGLLAIVWLRWRVSIEHAAASARFGVLAAVLYGVALFGLARHAEAVAAERYPGVQDAQANPMPGVPFRHRVVLAHADRYRVIGPDGSVLEFERRPADAVVRRALADPSIRGFANWTRFPWWQVEAAPGGWRVRFYDLRYARPGSGGGIGLAEVVVRDR